VRNLFRASAGLGAVIFAATFFLPPYFYNSPRMRFLWAYDAAFPLGEWGITLAFFAAAAAMAYPYFWAVTAVLTALFPRRRMLSLQLATHLAGGVIIFALSLFLLLIGDRPLPPAALWTALFFPPVFLLFLTGIYRRARPPKRWALLTGAGTLPFIPLQIIIGRAVVTDGGTGWGYFLGAAGATLCLAGTVGFRLRS